MRAIPMAVLTVALMVTALGAARSQTLITSQTGYTGPALSIGGYAGQPYTNTVGPIALPNGITVTSTSANSVIGSGLYSLGANGFSFGDIIGTNSAADTLTLSFSTPVSSFGAGLNYSPGSGADPVIAAYDASGGLIASYDLASVAPISTSGADSYVFLGINGGGTPIASFTLGGSYIDASAVSANAVSATPEPGAWALMIAGLALVGTALRRRRASLHQPR